MMTSPRIRIACIGECMVEMSPIENGLFQQAFAGDTLNTAVYATRSGGNEIEVSYITALGHDRFSDTMIDFFQNEQIDCEFIPRIKGEFPGLYAIQLDEQGERSFSYWRSDSAARKVFSHGLTDEKLEELSRAFDLYYISGITLAILDQDSRRPVETVIDQGSVPVVREWPSIVTIVRVCGSPETRLRQLLANF